MSKPMDLYELLDSQKFRTREEIESDRKEERELRKQANKGLSKRDRFINRSWRHNPITGSYSIKYKNIPLTVFPSRDNPDTWNYVYDDIFCNEEFKTLDEAKGALFDSIEKMIASIESGDNN